MDGTFKRLLACVALALLPAAGSGAAETVQSLRYGVSLFHLYQGDYFDSLTELMVGQSRGELGVHAENAELLRGGIALSYGMDREAERVFTALLAEQREGINRDRAWFYLAKLAWQRGEPGRAQAALDRTGDELGPELSAQALALHANLALRRGDMDAAARLAADLPPESDWNHYLDYNIAAALAAQGQFAAAAQRFQQLDGAEGNEEVRALRDRGFTAAGYARMAVGDFDGARADFTRVRLASPVSERALLGFGWAAFEQGETMAALSPWQNLSARPAISPSVRESLLAIPYAYQQLGRDGLALSHYQQASMQLQAELDNVRAAMEGFATDALPELLQIAPGDSDDWLFGTDILPVSEQAPYLRHLIASHPFQAAMKELRDLQRIRQRLARNAEKLAVLGQADHEQQIRWEAIRHGGGRDRLAAGRQAMLAQTRVLEQRLMSAEAQDDGRALAGPNRLAQWQRLERATSLAAQLDAPDAQRQLLRLYRGMLIWDDSEQFPDRRWRTRRELAELKSVLEVSSERLADLDRAIAGRRESNFAPRIAQLEARVAGQRGQVELALAAGESTLRQVAVMELQRQEQALVHSLGQSRLAVARLYDRHSAGAMR